MCEIYGTEGCSTQVHLDDRSCFICASACQEQQHFQFQENQQSAYSVDILWGCWWNPMISGESPAVQVKFPVLKAPDGMPHHSQRSEIFGEWLCVSRRWKSPRFVETIEHWCVYAIIITHIDNLLYIDIDIYIYTYIYRDHSVKVWQLWVLWCAYAISNRFLNALDGYIP